MFQDFLGQKQPIQVYFDFPDVDVLFMWFSLKNFNVPIISPFCKSQPIVPNET